MPNTRNLQMELITELGNCLITSSFTDEQLRKQIISDSLNLAEIKPQLTNLAAKKSLRFILIALFSFIQNIDGDNSGNKNRVSELLTNIITRDTSEFIYVYAALQKLIQSSMMDQDKEYIPISETLLKSVTDLKFILPILQICAYSTLKWAKWGRNDADEELYHHNANIIISTLKILFSLDSTHELEKLKNLRAQHGIFIINMQKKSREEQPSNKSWLQLTNVLDHIIMNKMQLIQDKINPSSKTTDKKNNKSLEITISSNGKYGSLSLTIFPSPKPATSGNVLQQIFSSFMTPNLKN